MWMLLNFVSFRRTTLDPSKWNHLESACGCRCMWLNGALLTIDRQIVQFCITDIGDSSDFRLIFMWLVLACVCSMILFLCADKDFERAKSTIADNYQTSAAISTTGDQIFSSNLLRAHSGRLRIIGREMGWLRWQASRSHSYSLRLHWTKDPNSNRQRQSSTICFFFVSTLQRRRYASF